MESSVQMTPDFLQEIKEKNYIRGKESVRKWEKFSDEELEKIFLIFYNNSTMFEDELCKEINKEKAIRSGTTTKDMMKAFLSNPMEDSPVPTFLDIQQRESDAEDALIRLKRDD